MSMLYFYIIAVAYLNIFLIHDEYNTIFYN